jgi:7-carboxy-7-deazaguanine synthase
LDSSYPYPELSVTDIAAKVRQFGTPKATITGGEPLLQRSGVFSLAGRLDAYGIPSTLETSGSITIAYRDVKRFSSVIMDLKPPSTEMVKKNCYDNLAALRKQDYVKFVLSDRADFDWMFEILERETTEAQIACGPRFGVLSPTEVVKWLEDAGMFHVQLNVQLHKYIFPHTEPYYKDLKDVDYAKEISLEK